MWYWDWEPYEMLQNPKVRHCLSPGMESSCWATAWEKSTVCWQVVFHIVVLILLINLGTLHIMEHTRNVSASREIYADGGRQTLLLLKFTGAFDAGDTKTSWGNREVVGLTTGIYRNIFHRNMFRYLTLQCDASVKKEGRQRSSIKCCLQKLYTYKYDALISWRWRWH